MKKSHIFLILSVVAFGLITVISVRAQEPSFYRTRGKPTPTPTLQPADVPIEAQIVGGQPADPGEYPWQVALVNAGVANPFNGQFCGGSLTDSVWVLTAAHCVIQSGLLADPASINVVLGVNNLSDGPISGVQGQRIAVDKIIPFPGYNTETSDSDLALLHLVTPATLGATVNPIELAGFNDSPLFEPGDTATTTGWGTLSEGGSRSNSLLEVAVPIVSNLTCNAPSSYNGMITANMLCAGLETGGKDACQGDSGGPLVVPNGAGGWLQAGVISWGNGCARPNFYGVYSRVSQYKYWISLQTNGPSAVVYLPTVMKSAAGIPITCKPSPPGESSNISNALKICSGQKVNGQVNEITDFDDVYKISVGSGQQLKISMNGVGGDADLILFPPGTTNVFTDAYAAFSATSGNNEFIEVTVFTAGLWYVDIYSYAGTTNYNLTVTISSP